MWSRSGTEGLLTVLINGTRKCGSHSDLWVGFFVVFFYPDQWRNWDIFHVLKFIFILWCIISIFSNQYLKVAQQT